MRLLFRRALRIFVAPILFWIAFGAATQPLEPDIAVTRVITK